MGFLSNFINGENQEILFFILVFLLLFNGNLYNKQLDYETDDSGTVLFFIVVFLLLFINSKHVDEID